MSTEIDWSKAPEDAQYFQDWRWYKIENNRVFTRHPTDDNAEWRESAWSVEDDLDNLPDFIKRPVSANQEVSTEAETATPTETLSIEAGSTKHLLGLTPKNLWEEQMQHQRRQDIHAAMQRYIEARKEIPNEWLEELMGLNNTLAGIETDFDEETQSLPVAKDDGEWIEWGKNEVPEGLEGYTIEREYTDGEYRKGRVGEYTWNDGYYIIDCDTVKRYRIIGEGEQE